MIERLWPLTSRAVRAIRPRELAGVADRTVVFDPGKAWNARPLLHLPNELDRMISHHPDSFPATNLELIECKGYVQLPTLGHLLKRAVVADGSVLTPSWLLPIRHQPRRAVLPRIDLQLHQAAMCSTYVSERYFGHWLRDQLPSELLAADLALEPLALPGTVRSNEPGYRELSGLQVRKPELALVDELWLFEDFAVTPHRLERLERFRNRLRDAAPRGLGHEVVYIGRSAGSIGRALANETELAAQLAEQGIATVMPETLEPAEIVGALRDARVVLGPEGSALDHALCAMPRGATLFEIQPPRQINFHRRIYCEGLDINYAIAIGDDIDVDSYSITPAHIYRTLDVIARAVS